MPKCYKIRVSRGYCYVVNVQCISNIYTNTTWLKLFFSYIKTTEGILDIEDVHDSENIGLKKDEILRIIDVLNDASDIASEFDIYYERAHVFKNSVFFQRKKI